MPYLLFFFYSFGISKITMVGMAVDALDYYDRAIVIRTHQSHALNFFVIFQ